MIGALPAVDCDQCSPRWELLTAGELRESVPRNMAVQQLIKCTVVPI